MLSNHEAETAYTKARGTAALLADFFDGEQPELAVVLGSGFGQIADQMVAARILSFDQLPGMKLSATQGHAGRFVLGELRERTVLFMQGRMHYYEGNEIEDVVLAVRAMKLAGIDKLILTNAAGAVNRAFKPGQLMLVKDHISLFCPSPLRGENDAGVGPRFPDQTHVYDPAFMSLAFEVAEKTKLRLQDGVYCYTQGPQYETPAEIDMLGRLGADAVGMSTVAEAIAASHAGMRILALSGITNMAAGISNQSLSHDDVLQTGRRLSVDLLKLLWELIPAI